LDGCGEGARVEAPQGLSVVRSGFTGNVEKPPIFSLFCMLVTFHEEHIFDSCKLLANFRAHRTTAPALLSAAFAATDLGPSSQDVSIAVHSSLKDAISEALLCVFGTTSSFATHGFITSAGPVARLIVNLHSRRKSRSAFASRAACADRRPCLKLAWVQRARPSGVRGPNCPDRPSLFFFIPLPPDGGDGADDRLSAGIDVDVFNYDPLLSARPLCPQSLR